VFFICFMQKIKIIFFHVGWKKIEFFQLGMNEIETNLARDLWGDVNLRIKSWSDVWRSRVIPITGFCASCLTERLSGIESSSTEPQPKLRRTKSCSSSAAADQDSSAVEPRRRSCEILAAPDDEKKKNKNLSSIRNRNLEIDSRISDFEGGDTVRVLVEHWWRDEDGERVYRSRNSKLEKRRERF
jgi:hypothetical protein